MKTFALFFILAFSFAATQKAAKKIPAPSIKSTKLTKRELLEVRIQATEQRTIELVLHLASLANGMLDDINTLAVVEVALQKAEGPAVVAAAAAAAKKKAGGTLTTPRFNSSTERDYDNIRLEQNITLAMIPLHKILDKVAKHPPHFNTSGRTSYLLTPEAVKLQAELATKLRSSSDRRNDAIMNSDYSSQMKRLEEGKKFKNPLQKAQFQHKTVTEDIKKHLNTMIYYTNEYHNVEKSLNSQVSMLKKQPK